MPLPLCSTFWRVKKPLICPIKAISYSSEEYFSLLFLSLMQFSVSSDPPDILCVALYLFLQQCFTVPMRKSMYQIFQLQRHRCQVQSAYLRAAPGAQKMVKSRPRPTRWHCGWLYQPLRTQAEFSWAWQLQSRLCGSDFQHKSLCLEPHPAVLSIQQLFGTLNHSKFRLFQITISIFFFSRSSTIIFFQFLGLPQDIPEVSRNI